MFHPFPWLVSLNQFDLFDHMLTPPFQSANIPHGYLETNRSQCINLLTQWYCYLPQIASKFNGSEANFWQQAVVIWGFRAAATMVFPCYSIGNLT